MYREADKLLKYAQRDKLSTQKDVETSWELSHKAKRLAQEAREKAVTQKIQNMGELWSITFVATKSPHDEYDIYLTPLPGEYVTIGYSAEKFHPFEHMYLTIVNQDYLQLHGDFIDHSVKDETSYYQGDCDYYGQQPATHSYGFFKKDHTYTLSKERTK